MANGWRGDAEQFLRNLHDLRDGLAQWEGQTAELQASLRNILDTARSDAAAKRSFHTMLSGVVQQLIGLERVVAQQRVALTEVLNDLDREGGQ